MSDNEDDAPYEKRWALKGRVTMEVGSHGRKKLSDNAMVVNLVFTYNDDPNPKVVGELLMFYLGLNL